jgi:mono/diheme cytochrome c family protein
MHIIRPLAVIVAVAFWLASPAARADEAQAGNQPAPAKTIDGEKLFASTCGFCHSNGGRKAGKGPKLAGTKRSDDFMTNRIKNGKKGRMPAFGGAFSDVQIKAIIIYIHRLEP